MTDEPAPDHELPDPERPDPEQPELPEPELARARGLGRGYRQDEVDEFVAELRRAYRHEPPAMAPYEVADQRFATTRRGKGYTFRSVDDYLTTAQERLRERHGEDAVAGVEGHGTERRHFPTLVIYLVAAVLIVAMVVFAVTQL